MISVITSVNNQEQYESFLLPGLKEAQALLRSVNLPELDLVTVEGSESIYKNYNEGLRRSIYQIKAYVHQDVNLLDPSWVFKVVRTFAENPEFGLLGMVGTTLHQDRGFWWDSGREHIRGELFSGAEKADWSFQPITFPTEVQCVDGFFMATNRNLTWAEHVLTGFHCYDMDMSREFRACGYRVGIIPHKAWHIGAIRTNHGVQETLERYYKRWGL